MMEEYIPDDYWLVTDSPNDWTSMMAGDSDSDGDIRYDVSDSEDEDIGTIPTITESVRADSDSGDKSKEVSSKGSVNENGDSAYGSPRHDSDGGESQNTEAICFRDNIFDLFDNITATQTGHRTVSPEPVAGGSGRRVCQVCGAEFFGIDDYNKHCRTHERFRKISCPFCKKIYNDGDAFYDHIITHQSEYFECKVCCKKFKNEQNFIKHKKSHNRWNMCNTCKKLFRTSDGFERHMKTHSTVENRKTLGLTRKRKLPSESDQGMISDNSDISTEDEDGFSDLPEYEVMEVSVEPMVKKRKAKDSSVERPLNRKFQLDRSIKLRLKKTICLSKT